ncbi:MAG: hypothetical protein SF051_16210 [Elusimicrobiota bacterium]|nr:hypothetical protein [Elusimicrobiota bacterium]
MNTMTFLPVLLLAVSASSAAGDALAELRRLAGAAAETPAVTAPAGRPVAAAAAAPAQDPVIRVTSTQWNPAFPLERKVVEAAGRAVGTKAFDRFSCEFTPGAAAARCDYAYDVWPEMCWYGYDHVVADLALSDGAASVVLREWRSH